LQQAQESKEEAERTYAHSLSALRTIVGLALIAGVGVTIWLIRSVVVRVKEYSGFATRVRGRRAQHEDASAGKRRAHGSRLVPQRDGGSR